MPATVEFFDSAVTVSPPNGHGEPFPLTLGASWQPGDVRLLLVAASTTSADQGGGSVTIEIPMDADPPTSPNFTSAYSLNPGFATRGVYYRYLQTADSDTSVKFPKPPGWRYFMWSALTARGVDPAHPPIAGNLGQSPYQVGSSSITIPSVTVPAAGTMVFFLGTFADPSGGWPSWPSSLGVPTGWLPITATDKSGINYYPYDTNPALLVIGKSYSTSGSTGSVSVPIYSGASATVGMYCFVRPAPDVSVSVGAA